MRSWFRRPGKRRTLTTDGASERRNARTGRRAVPLSLERLEDRINPAPTVLSIVRSNPASSATNAASVTYLVTFSESVTGVDAGDFALVRTGPMTATLGTVAGSGASYTVSVGSIAGNGTLGLNLVNNNSISGASGVLSATTVVGAVYTIDTFAPSTNFVSVPPALTKSDTATFLFIGIDQNVGAAPSGVASLKFSLDGGPFATTTSPLTFSGLISGPHTLQIQAIDNAGNAGTPTTSSWTIDKVSPKVQSIVRSSPTASPTNASSLVFTVTFSEAVTGVDTSDFILLRSGTTSATLSQVSGSGTTYNVTAAGVVFNGTVNLSLSDNNSIRDLAGNTLTSSFFAGLGSGSLLGGFETPTIAAADFNSDGMIDMAIADVLSSSVAIYLGNGNGLFQPGTLAAAIAPKAAAAGDLNNDGRADLVLVSSSSVGVLLGNGNGTFKAIQTFALDAGTGWIALGDLNGDGNLDAVATGSTFTDVLLGNGNGTFKPTSTLAGTGTFVTLVDINRDGKADILLDNKLATFLNNGDGTFLPPATFANTGAGQIAVGDFDNDGTLDLAAFNVGSSIRVTLGNGNGTYRAGATVATSSTLNPVATADFNGDGNLDLVVGHDFGPGLLLGNGNGTFATEATFGTVSSLAAPSAFTIADVNNDGRPDVFMPDPISTFYFGVLVDGQNGNLTSGSTTLDQTPPTVSITTQPPSLWVDSTATFAFTGADPKVNNITSGINRYEVSLDGAPFTTAVSPATVTSLTSGSHTFRVQAIDNVGNASSPASYTWTVDRTAPPTVLSLLRTTPAGTNASSVTYTVAFDGVVTGVDSGDFSVLATGSVISGALTVTGSGTSYTITVNAITGDGTLQLTLADKDSISAVENMLPLGGVGIGNGNFAGETYTIDQTAATATFTAQPAALSSSTSASFAFAGNDPTVGGVATGVNHFEGSLDGAPFVPVTNPIVVANLLSGSNTYRVRAVDNAGNAGTSVSFTWTVDATAPLVQSITPTASVTNANVLTYTATFSEPVTGVDASDFRVTTTGSVIAAVTQVTGSGAVYTVTLSAVGDGVVGLNLVDDNSIRDLVGNRLSSTTATPFLAALTLAVGINARGIPAADFDSDGKLDIAVADSFGNHLKLYLGNGNGTFRAGPTSAPMTDIGWDAAADLNGDGKADLALVSTSLAGTLLGNGDGSFKPIKTFSVDSSATWLTLADVNNDGVLDVIAPSVPATDVFLGNGDGTFKAKITIATFSGTRLDATDLNGDGRIDLVVNNTPAVALGNGDGTFQPRIAIPNMGTSSGFAVGDYTGDTIPDLVAFSGSAVKFFTGVGDGTFQAGTSFTTSSSGRAMAATDVNRDGKLDLVLGHDSLVGVLLGNGNGTFASESTFSVGSSLGSVYGLTLADINADGRLDLVAGDPNTSQTVSVLLNNEDGDFTGTTTTVDQTLPTTTILSGPLAFTVDSTATFAFSAADPTAGGVSTGINRVEVSLDGSTFATATSPVTYGSLADGNHVFQVRSVDNAGNVGVAAVHAWTSNATLPPTVVAIQRSAPTGTATNAGSVVYSVTFNGVVSGVDPTDFAVQTTGTLTVGGLPTVSGSGNVYAVTVGGILGDGTLALKLVDDDSIVAVSNGKPLGDVGIGNGSVLGDVYTIDRTLPTTTITSQPAAVTQNTSATFTFAGNDPIAGGLASGLNRLEASLDGGTFAAATSPMILYGLVPGAHTVQLRAVDNVGNAGAPASYAWTIDQTDPQAVSIVRTASVGSPTNATSITYAVSFSEPVTGVDVADFSLAKTGTIAGTISQVTGSGSSYVVTVSAIAGDGTLGFNLVDNSTIRDLAGNPLTKSASPVLTSTFPTLSFSSQVLASADFDSDGNADLTAPGASAVQLYLGNGNGNFHNGGSTTGLSSQKGIGTADLNGDGKADLVVSANGTLGVYVGNGNGTFKPISTFALDTTISWLTLADVNGDGKMDAVTVGNGIVDVLLGNGDATFKPKSTFAASGSYVVATDLNVDGKIDLVFNSPLSVYVGNGDGTFKAPATTMSTPQAAFAVGDFDGDGKPDLFLGNGSSSVRMLLGNGDGTFRTFGASSTVGGTLFMLAAADLNGDGKLDVVVGKSGSSLILPGNGNGSFGTAITGPSITNLTSFEAFTIADFDGDSRADLVIPVLSPSTQITFLHTGGNGNFTGPVTTIDQTLPTMTLAASPTSFTVDPTAVFTFTGSDPTAGGVSSGVNRFEISVDGAPFAAATSPVTLTGLTDGNHTFQTRIIDNAGNVGALVSFPWTVSASLPPTITSIRKSVPTTSPTNVTSVVYAVAFNGTVTGVDPSDFSVVATGTLTTSPPVVAGSGSSYTVTVNGISGDGTLALNLVDDDSIVDIYTNVPVGGVGSGNGNFSAGEVYTIDRTAAVVSITSSPPAFTQATSATFVFSGTDPLTGGVASGLNHLEAKLDSATFAAVTSPLTFSGLTIASHTLQIRAIDNVGNVSAPTTYTWTIDQTRPVVQSITRTAPASSPTNATSATFAVVFSEAVTGVDLSDFKLSTVGSVAGSIAQVTGSGSTYSVTVTGILGNGTVGLNFVDNHSIADLAGNRLGVAFPGFVTKSSNFVLSNVNTEAIGDFNSDGIPDIVAGNFEGTIDLLTGNGDGSFAPVAYTRLTMYVKSIAVADFNRDGKADLVVGNANSLAVSVLFGNGDGTFTAPVTFASGRANFVTTADLDRDGNADILFANSDGNTVVVMLGNGNGTFKPQTSNTVGPAPAAITSADFNGDGIPDLAVGNFNNGSGSLSVLLGNGNGTFKPQTTAAGITSFAALIAGDLNNDGKSDLVIGGFTDLGGMGVLLGNGNGTFGLTTFAGSVSSIALADFDGTGTLDIAVARGDGITVFPGNGDGTLKSPFTYPSGQFAKVVLPADLNGDGRLDLAVAAYDAQEVDILLGAGNDLAGAPVSIDQTPPSAPTIASGPASTSLDPTAAFTFAAVDPTAGGVSSGVAGYQTSVDGAPFTSATSPASYSGLANGSHVFQVRAIDAVGNVGPAASYPWTIDATAIPTVVSLRRTTPTTSPTNASPLVYSVTFNGVVTGVDASDFSVVAVGSVTAGAPVVSGSGTTYSVTLPSVVGNGSLQLKLVDNDSIIASANGIRLGGVGAANGNANGDVTGIDQTVPVQFAKTGPPSVTNSTSATFTFVAQDVVTGGFASGINRIEASLDNGLFLTVTSPFTFSHLALGAHSVSVRMVDNAGNTSLDGGTTWTIDRASPRVQSIVASIPAGATNTSSIAYTVTFTKPVTGVDVSDFRLATTGVATGSITNATGSGTSYVVTVTGISGDGTLGLNLVDNNSIMDAAGNILYSSSPSPLLPATLVPVNNSPAQVPIGDFNGDGIPDLVITNSNGASTLAPLFIEFGNGDGTFAAGATLTVPAASRPSIGDVNGDGILDVADVTVFSVAAILLGNGDGTFRSLPTFAVSSGISQTELADVNRDGKLDLITKDFGGIGIYLGNGDGTFGKGTFIRGRGDLAATLVVIDVNFDGNLDFVFAGTSTVEAYLGNGDGTFKVSDVSSSIFADELAVGDVNGDGKIDIVAFDEFNNRRQTFFGNGDGTFTSSATVGYGADIARIALADVDGDGKLDLVASRTLVTPNVLSVSLGNGNGTFAAEKTYSILPTMSPL